jgi:hypothetical protein
MYIDPNEIPLVEVVDAWEIFVGHARGHVGSLQHPSNDQLIDAFGSTNFDDIFDFMAKNGYVQSCGRHAQLEGHEKG